MSAITTDIIAGFPGETEDEFAETLDFVREMNFAGGHVFTYSPRPGTGAARMKGQIKPELRKKRNHILQEALEESAKSYREKFVGRKMSVLWESTSEMGEWGWKMEGWTENYLRVQRVRPVAALERSRRCIVGRSRRRQNERRNLESGISVTLWKMDGVVK